MIAKKLVVEPGTKVKLVESNASRTLGLTKEKAETVWPALASEMKDLQELLYAAGKHAVLVVLQGMDTSGKDGTIKHVMDPVNPVGVRVYAFKTPTPLELRHDFLWRVHSLVPPRGMLGIFNRSHYEDVVIVRVHELVPRSDWRKRYRHITDFERLLTDSGVIVLKFFLHISKQEQEERLLEREEEVEKAWKLSAGDWQEREHWDEYVTAYEDAITKTSTANAPWYVIPADRKWARNHLIASVIVERLSPYRAEWLETLQQMGKEAKEELDAYRMRGA